MSWKFILLGLFVILPGCLCTTGQESDGNEQGDRRIAYVENSEKEIVQERKNSHVNPGGLTEVGAQKEKPLALAVSNSNDNNQASADTAIATNSILFIVIVAGCTLLATVGVVGAGVCWYKYNRRTKAANIVDYPAYGVTGPAKDQMPAGDRKLAQSAQMYHYQHQKQQMIAMEKANGSMKHDASEEESEEDNAEGDYTVYECPGLAPTGEMEVKNPLFRGDETPTTPTPTTPVNEDPPPLPPPDQK